MVGGKELERKLEEQDKRIAELNETISHGIEKKDERMEGIEGTLKAILEILGSKSGGETDNGKVPMGRDGGLNRIDSEGRYSTFANYSQILSPFTHTNIPVNNSQLYPNVHNMPPPIVNQTLLGPYGPTLGQNLQNPHMQYAKPYMCPPNQFPPKMDFPKFDGNDPRGWAIKCDQFFYFYPMDDLDKVKYASIHFEGKSSDWYQYYHVGRELVPWRDFVNDVISKFAIREHEDPQEEFNKLIQSTTVEAYVDEFEELRALIIPKQGGLTNQYFISSFLSGLKGEIKGVVKMAKPTSLGEAIELARQAEYNMSGVSKPNAYSTQTNSKPSPYTKPQNLAYLATSLNSNSINKPGSQTISPKSTQKPLTSYEINVRRKKGLCFHCDEMYSVGHTCKTKLYSLFGEEEDAEQEVKEIVFNAEVKGEDPVQQVEEVVGDDPVEEVEGDDPVQQVEEEGGDVVQQIEVEGGDPVQVEVEGGDPVQKVEVEGGDPVQQVEVDYNAKEEEHTWKTKLNSLNYNKSYEVIRTAATFLGATVVYFHKLWSRDNGAKEDHHLPRQQSRSISPRSEKDQNTTGQPRSVSQTLSPRDKHNSNLRSLSQKESSQNPSQSYRNHGARGDHYSSRQQSKSPLIDQYHNSGRPRSFSPPLSQRSSSPRESYQSPYDGSYVRDRSASSWRNSRSPSGSLSRSYREYGAQGDHYSSRRSTSPDSDQYRNSFRRPSSFSPPLSQRASSQRSHVDYVRDRPVGSWRNSRSPPRSPPRSYRGRGAWGDHSSQESRSTSPSSDGYRNSSRRPRSVSPALSQRSSSQGDSYQSPYDDNYSPARSESSWRETRSPSRSPSRSYRDHGSRGTISRHANNLDEDLTLGHYIENPRVREAVVSLRTTNIMSASFQQAGEENENPTLISFSMLQSSAMEARFSDRMG